MYWMSDFSILKNSVIMSGISPAFLHEFSS
jgi:hypothetical protein